VLAVSFRAFIIDLMQLSSYDYGPQSLKLKMMIEEASEDAVEDVQGAFPPQERSL